MEIKSGAATNVQAGGVVTFNGVPRVFINTGTSASPMDVMPFKMPSAGMAGGMAGGLAGAAGGMAGGLAGAAGGLAGAAGGLAGAAGGMAGGLSEQPVDWQERWRNGRWVAGAAGGLAGAAGG